MVKTKRAKKKSFRQVIRPEGGWSDMLRGDTLRFIFGVVILIVALFLLLSFSSYLVNGYRDQAHIEAQETFKAANYGGRLGGYTAYYFLQNCFGLCSFFIPIFLLGLSMKLMRTYKIRLWKWFLNCVILLVWGSIVLSISQANFFPQKWIQMFPFDWGGGHGIYINNYLCDVIGLTGAIILMIALGLLYLVYLTDETIVVFRNLMHPKHLLNKVASEAVPENTDSDNVKNELNDGAKPYTAYKTEIEEFEDEEEEVVPQDSETGTVINLTEEIPIITANQTKDEVNLSKASSRETDLVIVDKQEEEKATQKTVEEVLQQEPFDPRKDLENYKFPTLDLLKVYSDNGPKIDMDEQQGNKNRIINVLKSFGVDISAITATIGPTITLYEVTPAPGVRINKIRNLEDDIALSLSALGIRIIAPIPGKGTIGIEVPNKTAKIVSMESILNSKRFQETKADLPIALGKTITNEVFMVDLAKMPHLLVAGATGQGKSVGLNAIITSLLYKKHPAELKLVMVDPKKVEFSVYTPIERHFLAKIPTTVEPIITDVTKVVQTLKSLCQVMDHRYDLLRLAHVRNIKEYNAKFKARKLNPKEGHEFMPYIVVIIDEFGDLIMTAGKEVELPIARIAQLARAVGMHMVIATQRPTTNIITGTIKANFPARMAFKVMSVIDSRTILDRTGANQLIGRGDMLFLHGNEPVRVQCAFVDTPEVERINDFICKQQAYLTAFELPEVESEEEVGNAIGQIDKNSLDPMFEDAARLIVIHQQGSTSLIQRKFSIGFNRAGRLMDQLEHFGIVGPSRGAKPREVLVTDDTNLEALLNDIRH
ncbi:DNA translocase FtsK [Alloprevotella tannerae]|uniref:DNA translocase FtsK n=1 Tax=Alloprevotella tannerae TaxID=76122 RepID=A0A929WXC0_9BACT|nr:DNA translocase FtsK [Alloprevotella tannerae]MBF0970000.1 DNA translocase FtsK [Alloprevotella tannerae]